jgi:hypothetical protein
MKSFTVKDFITYNSPCFICESKINFTIGVLFNKKHQPTLYLTPFVTNDFIEVNLKFKYSDNGLKLKIFPKTNRFEISSMKNFMKYLEEHKLFLRSYCDTCYTRIESNPIEFNLLKFFIAPAFINDESVIVKNDNSLYELYSLFDQNYSTLIVSRTDIVAPPIRIELPLLPIYKLKNRDRFIEKVKTYILFS